MTTAYGNNLARYLSYIFIGMVLGTATVLLPIKVVITLACSMFVLYAIVYKPEFCVLILVVLISSIIFEDSLPLVSIGVGSLQLSDILLLALLMTIPIKKCVMSNTGLIVTKLDKPLGLFLLLSFVSSYVAIAIFHVDFNTVMRLERLVCYYGLFYVITNLIVNERQIRFIIEGLIAIGTVVALVMIVQSIIGDSVVLMPGRVENAGTFDEKFEVLRLLPPGQTLLYLLSITLMSLLAQMNENRIIASRYFYCFLAVNAGIILTYNRSYWVAIIFAYAVMAKQLTAVGRKRMLTMAAVIVLIGTFSVLVISGANNWMSETVDSVTSRFVSLGKGKELGQSGPLEDRLTENGYALGKISQHPLVGIGLGNEYRPPFYGNDDDLSYYVHNGYLWLLLDMGVVGFISFLWLYILFLYRGFRNWQYVENKLFRAVALGFTVGGLGILPMALVDPVFMQWYSILILAIMLGLNEAIFRIDSNRYVPSASVRFGKR